MSTNGIWASFEARVGNDPELREVAGTMVCNLSLASTERKQNKQTQKWEDGITTWVRAAVWGAMATNVSTSIMKGQLVNVTGILSERKYDTDQGSRSQLELRVEMIAPSLRFAQAQVIPNERGGGGYGQQQPQQQAQAPQGWTPGQPVGQAPWQSGPPQGQPVAQRPAQPPQQPVRTGGQPGPQPQQEWATPAYQGDPNDEIPF